jgi:hypothetical protein
MLIRSLWLLYTETLRAASPAAVARRQLSLSLQCAELANLYVSWNRRIPVAAHEARCEMSLADLDMDASTVLGQYQIRKPLASVVCLALSQRLVVMSVMHAVVDVCPEPYLTKALSSRASSPA